MPQILPPHTEQLLRALAERNSVTVADILREPAQTSAKRPKRSREELIAGQLQISIRCAAEPLLDHRSASAILGYNDQGVFD